MCSHTLVRRKPYPSDVSDDEWSLVVPYLTLMTENAPQREHSLRELFNALRYVIRYGIAWRAMRSTPQSGQRAGYDGAKRKRGSKVHLAVDTLGHLLALHVTPADVGDREAVARLAADIQDATAKSVELAFVDQGYTGEKVAEAAAEEGIRLHVVKLPEAKRGFVLLPRRWVVERSFAWATRCRRLVKDYERYAETLAAFHVIAFVGYMLKHAAALMQVHNTL